jgi:hypothetical protein
MNISINIFFEVKILKSYPIWPNKMAIYVIGDSSVMIDGFQYPLVRFSTFVLLYPLVGIELMGCHYWISKHHQGVPTILVITFGSLELLFNFFSR